MLIRLSEEGGTMFGVGLPFPFFFFLASAAFLFLFDDTEPMCLGYKHTLTSSSSLGILKDLSMVETAKTSSLIDYTTAKFFVLID